MKEVTIYTDGGAIGNPGPGGYGAVLLFGNNRREISGAYRLTTNNRMELSAAIEALKLLKSRCKVRLYSDSQYVVNAINKGWAERWRANGWMRNKKDPALNSDLWEVLLDQLALHDGTLIWVKGHSGIAENERCDQLTHEAIQNGNLATDTGYESNL